MIRFSIIIFLGTIFMSCASRKKYGLHFQSFSYNVQSRHDGHVDAFKRPVQTDTTYEQSPPPITTPLIDKSEKEVRSTQIKQEKHTTPELPFEYKRIASAEEYRIDQDINIQDFKTIQKDRRSSKMKKRNKKYSSLEPFGLVSFFLALFNLGIGGAIGGVGAITIGIPLAIIGLIFGIISLTKSQRKPGKFRINVFAKIGLLVSGILLILGLLIAIMAPPHFFLLGGLT